MNPFNLDTDIALVELLIEWDIQQYILINTLQRIIPENVNVFNSRNLFGLMMDFVS